MAGESDQTKWVGVRPTDPAEAIPVEEQSPVTGVYTKKAPPAVADAQAIKGEVISEIVTNPGSGGDYNHEHPAVPAGEAWMIQIVLSSDLTSIPTTITHYLISLAGSAILNYRQIPPVAFYLSTFAPIYLVTGSYIRCRFKNVSGGDWLSSTIVGWSIPVY